MTGTLRQKTRVLHNALHYVGVGFAYLGASIVFASRLHEAQLSADAEPAPLAGADVACVVALLVLSLQIVFATPHDVDDPLHVAFGALAYDSCSFAQRIRE